MLIRSMTGGVSQIPPADRAAQACRCVRGKREDIETPELPRMEGPAGDADGWRRDDRTATNFWRVGLAWCSAARDSHAEPRRGGAGRMRQRMVTLLAVAALTAGLTAVGRGWAAAPEPAASDWTVPDIDKLPDDTWGQTVRYGHDLITRTYALIGPEISDPSKRYAGNNLSCGNCHLAAGTQQFALPFRGVYAAFPNYRARSGTVGTIEDRIEGCMSRSMNGKALPLSSREMTALVAYMKFLSDGRPVGAPTPGRGPGTMPALTRAAEPVHGAEVYKQTCAACHGANGQGQRNGQPGDAKGYLFPPLWGTDSFNDGAGMHRLIDAANFVHANMPNGTTWQAPVVSSADAWDVAAYIEAQPRPHKTGLEQDYPDRLQKPVDTPYGPYADSFSEQQHRFGPFQPIRAELDRLRSGDKAGVAGE